MGAVDFIFLRQAPERINYEGFAIVEQDMYLAPLDKPGVSQSWSSDDVVSRAIECFSLPEHDLAQVSPGPPAEGKRLV